MGRRERIWPTASSVIRPHAQRGFRGRPPANSSARPLTRRAKPAAPLVHTGQNNAAAVGVPLALSTPAAQLALPHPPLSARTSNAASTLRRAGCRRTWGPCAVRSRRGSAAPAQLGPRKIPLSDRATRLRIDASHTRAPLLAAASASSARTRSCGAPPRFA